MVKREGVDRHAMTDAEPEHAPVDSSRVAALVPEQLLQPGEVIILLLKPSAWYILIAPLRAWAIIALLYMLARSLGQVVYDVFGLGQTEITMLALAVAGVRLFWQFLEWLSRVYILTDRRVVRIRGVIRVHVFEAPLKQIQHTQLFFSFRERVFGLGTIGFATAGTGMMEAYWLMLNQPLDVHQKVVHALNRYR